MVQFQEVYDAFLPYRDQYGLNQLAPNSVSQNGVLFTVEYLLVLKYYIQTPEDQNKFDIEVERLKGVFSRCEVLSGLLRRHPDSTEYDSMDNNGAALIFDMMTNGSWGFANRMRNHGLQVKCAGVDYSADAQSNAKWFTFASLLFGGAPKNYWNNTKPELFCAFSWWDWVPGFMGIIDMAAIGNTTIFRKLIGWISLMVSPFTGYQNTDSKKLSYVTWQVFKNRNWFWKLSYKLWCMGLDTEYQDGMKEVYAIYYQDVNHPIRIYSPKY